MHSKCCFIIILLLFSSLSAQTTTTFSDSTVINDSWLDRSNTTAVYNNADTMLIQNALVAFSPAVIRVLNINDSIATTATVIACSLKIHIEQIIGSKQIEIRRSCKSWTEGYVCHDKYKLFTAWGYSGGQLASATDCDSCGNTGAGTGDDYEGNISTSATFSDTGWVTIPIDTCHANAWVSNSDANNGIQLYDTGLGSNYNTITISSSESSNSPEFIFVWTDGGGVPSERHGADGVGVRHSGDGASARHGG